MLIDRGLLVEDGGVYRAEGSLDALEVPESLHALIAARLDSLPAIERSLLQDAAVLGKSFTATALSAVTSVPQPDIEPALNSLVGKDLLAIQSDPRSPERGQYVFVQDLIRQRGARDAGAPRPQAAPPGGGDVPGERLGRRGGDRRGRRRAPRGGVRRRARRSRRAGDSGEGTAGAGARCRARGFSGGAASAQRYYEHALELADGDAARARLHERAGKAARLQGLGAELRAHFESARGLYVATAQPLGEAMVLCELAADDFAEGNVAGALQRTREALATLPDGATDDEHMATLAHVEARLARFMYFSSDYDAALPHLERALQIAETANLWGVLALALDTKGSILAARGRRTEAELVIRGALNVALEHDITERAPGHASAWPPRSRRSTSRNPPSRCTPRRRGCCSGSATGPTPRVRNSTGSSASSTSAGGTRPARCSPSTWRTTPRSSARDCGRGPRRWARRGCTFSGVTPRQRGECSSPTASLFEHAHLEMRAGHDAARALLANAEGDHALALTTAEATLRACIDESFPVWMRLALIDAVEAAFALGDIAKVVEIIALVRENFRVGRQPSMDAQVLRWEARMAARRNDTEAAIATYRSAIDGFAALERPFWLAVARLELGELLRALGRDDEAQELLAQARATFAELRATPWTARASAGPAVATMKSTALPA